MTAEDSLALDILLVDDDDVLRRQLARALERRGCLVRVAPDGHAALQAVADEPPEVMILDMRMPDLSGLEVLESVRDRAPTTRVLMLTGYGSVANAVDAMRLGAIGYLQKPADAEDVLAAIQRSEQPVLQPRTDNVETPSLARAEWEHIHRVLSDCGGNISEASRRLKIHRRSLQRKLQKFAPP
ncbi:MAG: response regulator [Deltaproteobacteria bacterium]|nr:MAG: response regulator [Deltaproteobacteria bacterium]